MEMISKEDVVKRSNISDVFESSLRLEETQLQKGYNEGYNDGISIEKEEGKQVGLKHGFEVGEEIGFYRGCVDIWKSAIGVEPDAFSVRVQKDVKKMGELLQRYPLMDPEDESLQEIMSNLRLRFRVITTNLGVKIDYEGYPKEDNVIDF
ncbi:Oral cancer overexpressed protein 1 [Zostera marina]|uniref:Oral cancer overexpressed protein 1 n=1 Tax=Zostera marina TaxID=29655 RepID=A0A0K9P2X9_ZOSMR|nr:Oral cancer overexpressed protein 1 [Zostera marina]